MPSARVRSVAATFVTLGLAYGVWYSYSVFLVALLREFGWSRSVLAGAFSLFVLVHGLVSAPIGLLADRLGPRRLVVTGGLILAAGLALVGAVQRPWQLYLAFGVVTSVGVAAAGWVPAVVLVQRLFPRRVGLALGATSSGIGMGIFLVVPLCQFLIDAFGWRSAFRLIGAAVVLWIVPATLAFVRDPPLERTAAPAPSGPRAAATPARGDVTMAQAVRLPRYWLLAFGQFLGSFACQMLLVHQVVFLVDHAIPALVAASVASLVGLASIAGKIGGGWFSDVVGREVTYTLGMVSVVASIGVLGIVAAVPGPLPAYAYATLIGLGYSVTSPVMPAVIADLFRGRHYGAIFGTLHLATAVGGSAGPWVAGRVFDTTGSYRNAFAAAVLSATAATIALWIAGPRRAPRP